MKAWYLGCPYTRKVVGLVVAKDIIDLFRLIDERDNPHEYLYLRAKYECAFVSENLYRELENFWGDGMEDHMGRHGCLPWMTFVELVGGREQYDAMYPRLATIDPESGHGELE